MKDSHLLCVSVEPYYPVGRRKRDMAEDLRNRTNHDTVLYVLVTVLDANDKGPKFVLDTDYKGGLDSSLKSVFFTQKLSEDSSV